MQVNSPEFKKVLRELQLKVDPRQTDDLQQIHNILITILCYPDRAKADVHHRASNIGRNDLLQQQEINEQEIKINGYRNLGVCECCGVLASNTKVPFCTSFDQLNLGVGVHMFFKNYLFHAVVFFLLFCIYSIYALVTNINSYNRYKQQMIGGFLCFFSTGADSCGLSPIGGGSKILLQNQQTNNLSQVQSWIAVGFVSLWGLLYIAKTYFQQRFIAEMQKKTIYASDFTLMLTHIPRSFFIESEINPERPTKSMKINSYGKYQQNKEGQYKYLSQQDLKKKFNKMMMDYGNQRKSQYSYEVVKVNVAKPLYQKDQEQIKKQTEARKKLNDKLEVFRTFIKQRKYYPKFLTRSETRIQYYEDYEKFYFNYFDKNAKRQVEYADDNVVFLTMKFSKARQQIQRNNMPPSIKNFWNCCKKNQFPIQGVKVRKAPHPQQIKWKSIGFPLQKKRLRRFFVWMLTLLLIGISLGISIGIAFINKNSINIGVSIGISIVVSAINVFIQLIIAYASYYQNEYILSREQSSIALKVAFSQLINSIGVPIIVTLISQAHTGMTQKSWLGEGGLVDDVFFIAAINVIVPIVLFFDPWEIYLKLRRWYFTKPYNRLQIYQQKQFNKQFGNYTFDIGYEYAYLIKTSIFTAFFVCMQPIIAIFAPIGLIIYYFATKRNLLNHIQRPGYHFSTINKTVDIMLLFSLLAFGFGCLFVNNFIKSQIGTNADGTDKNNGTLLTNWIIVMVAVLFLFVVPLRIFYVCMKKPERKQNQDFQTKNIILTTDFDRLNPQTQQKALQNFKNNLLQQQKKKGIPQQAQILKQSVFKQLQQKQRNKADKQMMASKISNIRNSANKFDETPQPIYNTNIEEYKNIVNSLGGESAIKPGQKYLAVPSPGSSDDFKY